MGGKGGRWGPGPWPPPEKAGGGRLPLPHRSVGVPGTVPRDEPRGQARREGSLQGKTVKKVCHTKNWMATEYLPN